MNRNLSEFQLIHLLTSERHFSRDDVFLGVGDDAAIVKEEHRYLLFTCDAQVETIHFLSNIPGESLGRRLAAVNLSDIAAMGGSPTWALCSLFPGPSTTSSFMRSMYDGMIDAFGVFSVQLIGGNVAASRSGLTADVFLVGEVPHDQVLLRRGAQAGDAVCVTGTLGDSAAGLTLLRSGADDEAESVKYLIARHILPTPRVEVGRILAMSGWVHACMDISDGLLQDATHMAVASEVHIQLDEPILPISPQLAGEMSRSGGDPVAFALTGGEDYELLFTMDARRVNELRQRVYNETGVGITVVGTVASADSTGPRVSVADDRYLALGRGGFDHLRDNRHPKAGDVTPSGNE